MAVEKIRVNYAELIRRLLQDYSEACLEDVDMGLELLDLYTANIESNYDADTDEIIITYNQDNGVVLPNFLSDLVTYEREVIEVDQEV